MLGTLSLEEKQKRHIKIKKFFGFIHYNWGDESEGDKVNEKSGEQPWQIFKGVHNYVNATNENRQFMKRKFYQENVDKEFETIVGTENEEERVSFQKYCQLYNALGELGFTTLIDDQSSSSVMSIKRLMYLLFLILKPMNIPWSGTLFFIGAMMSLLQRNGYIGGKPSLGVGFLQSFIEEECMNIFLMVFLLPSGVFMRFVIYISLSIWALLHVTMLAEAQLESDPNTIGLASLTSTVDWIVLSKVEIVFYKSYIECLIAICCVPMCLLGYVAILFPILYFQYIRIKFVSNSFMKEAFNSINTQLRAAIPAAIYDSMPVAWFRGWLWSYVTFDKGDSKKNEESKEGDSSFRNNQGVQGDQRTDTQGTGSSETGVQRGTGANDQVGKEPDDNSKRVFADMMDKTFRTNFNFGGNIPDLDQMQKEWEEEHGPSVEEVDSDDLD